jgi:hypothetical protein
MYLTYFYKHDNLFSPVVDIFKYFCDVAFQILIFLFPHSLGHPQGMRKVRVAVPFCVVISFFFFGSDLAIVQRIY